METFPTDPATMAWADIAAYLTVVVVVLATVTALVFMGRATLRACGLLGLGLLVTIGSLVLRPVGEGDVTYFHNVEAQP